MCPCVTLCLPQAYYVPGCNHGGQFSNETGIIVIILWTLGRDQMSKYTFRLLTEVNDQYASPETQMPKCGYLV